MRNKLFRRADILLAFACLFLAAVFFLWSFLSPSGGIAVIEQNGIEVGRYVLSASRRNERADPSGAGCCILSFL